MFKSAYHAKAFLTLKKNVHRGLVARTRILSQIEVTPLVARAVAEKTGLSYESSLHHLRLLEAEHIVTRSGERPYVWTLTGAGQQTLLAE